MRMATTYGFTCPQGHKFDAVAKLRARCPECGQTARRNFSIQSEPPTPPISSPSSHKVVTRKGTGNGLKSGLTSTKETPPDLKPGEKNPNDSKEPTVKSEPSTKKPVVIRQGMKRQMPRTVKKPATVTAPKAKASGPVKRVVARVGHTPTVTRPPKGSKERKVLAQTEDIPYWQKVKNEFFR